ncbi:MAG: hypothetical protein K6G79_04575 [Bacteroidales bacterium]|nr:hypothetical protein [Bacteroidales bacterium]
MPNQLNLVIFSSSLHDNNSVMQSRESLFEGLRSIAELQIIYPSMLAGGRPSIESLLDGGRCNSCDLPHDDTSRTVCFIATGGTEEIFKDYLETIPRPVMLLSDGLHNSFAASLEIKTWLTAQGVPSTLFNAPLDSSPEFFESLGKRIFGSFTAEPLELGDPVPTFPKNVLKSFEKTKIGLVGGASGWLISSEVDIPAVESRYGVKFEEIPLSEIESRYAGIAGEDPGIDGIVERMERYLTGDRHAGDLRDAARMYLALKGMCTEHSLGALTLKCFGILNSCRTTACLGFSLLNDEGIVAGCEGDIPALWTMLYVRHAFGEEAFMANPASSSRRELTVDFAHCTIPLGMVHGYRLPSHFESRTGIGIAGSVPSGRYCIIKISGTKLDRYYSSEGDIIMNTNIPQRCRTQVRFRFPSEEEFDRFFRVSKGNHIILCRASGQGAPSR